MVSHVQVSLKAKEIESFYREFYRGEQGSWEGSCKIKSPWFSIGWVLDKKEEASPLLYWAQLSSQNVRTPHCLTEVSAAKRNTAEY